MQHISKMLNKFDQWMAAVTFAEAGESQTAMEFLEKKPRKRNIRRKVTGIRKDNRKRPVLRV